MLKIWDFFNGKKTVLSAVIIAIISFLNASEMSQYVKYVEYIADVLLAIGVIHKIVKGELINK